MENSEQSSEQEMVLVTLELPRDLVDWIDGLKAQLGFRSRGVIVAQLIRELVSELEEEATDEETTQAA
jgi:metal-responsive CopG/Arc/MetJ family transcriptional regulator